MRALKPNHSCAQPTTVAAVAVRSIRVSDPGNDSVLRGQFVDGALVSGRLDHGDITRRQQLHFTSPTDFWPRLYSLAQAKKSLWVWASSLGDTLALLRAWDEVDAGRLRLTYDMGRKNGRLWRGNVVGQEPPCLCTFRTSGGALVRMAGTENFGFGGEAHSSHVLVSAGQTLQFASRLAQFFRTQELGVMRPTVGAAAMAAYRHRFMAHVPVARHAPGWEDYERTYLHPCEHRCYFIGATKEPVYRLDLTGAYTAAMQRALYPQRHWRTQRCPCPATAAAHAERLAVLVRAYLSRCPYPVPFEDRKGSTWRAGSGWVRLPGPDYLRAIRARCVREVSHMSVYDSAPLLKDYADGMWALRMEYRAAGDSDMENVVKRMANALHGALARTKGHWYTAAGPLPGRPWGERHHRVGADGPAERVRGVGPDHQRYSDADEPAWCMPSVAAYVLAYHRQLMQSYIDLCPPRSVYYLDADSLHVSEAGLSAIAAAAPLSDTIPGRMRVESGPDYATYRAYQSYDHAGRSLHSGVDMTGAPDGRGRYLQTQHISLNAALSAGKPESPLWVRQWVKPPRDRVWCSVGADGWTTPLEM